MLPHSGALCKLSAFRQSRKLRNMNRHGPVGFQVIHAEFMYLSNTLLNTISFGRLNSRIFMTRPKATLESIFSEQDFE